MNVSTPSAAPAHSPALSGRLLALDAARRWWAALMLVLLLAGALRLVGYNFGLPYVEHLDEPNYYLAGLEWRGLYDNFGYYDSVPPGYIFVHAALQPVLEAVGIADMAGIVGVLRLVSIAANLLTLIIIARTARLAAGDLAGILAGAAWGFAPLVIENGRYALPDPLLYLLVALALWLAAVALTQPKRASWCVWSVVAALAAIVLKYPVVPALLPGVLVALWIFRRERRAGLRYLLMQAALIALTAFLLIFGYGVNFNTLQREGAVIREQGFNNLLNAGRVLNNLYHVFVPLNAPFFVITCVLGVIAYWWAGRHNLRQVRPGVTLLCLSLIVTLSWLAASFSEVSEVFRLRDVLPATTAACVLLGAALAQIVWALPVPRREAWRAAVVSLPLVALVFIPQVEQDWQMAQARTLPERRVELRQWFDTNLPPGTVLVDESNEKTFNPFWGGIPYQHWFDWWRTDDFTQYTPAEWREKHGISYAVIPAATVRDLRDTPRGRAFLRGLLPLREFNAPEMRGPAMNAYRLGRMSHEAEAHFGEAITLRGYDLSAENAQPGDMLELTLYWQAQAVPGDNYSAFVHLVPQAAYEVVAQADGAPATPQRPTLTWHTPGEILISPPFHLPLPADLAPGVYRLFIGLYNYQTGARLPLSAGDAGSLPDALLLTTIHIE